MDMLADPCEFEKSRPPPPKLIETPNARRHLENQIV